MEKYSAGLLIHGAFERERYLIPDDTSAHLLELDLVPIFTQVKQQYISG
jgi:hypothetical protein